jgi:hypothetical protein
LNRILDSMDQPSVAIGGAFNGSARAGDDL